MMGNFFDAVELSSNFSMMEIDALPEWVGHSLRGLNLRAKKDINVIGLKRDDNLNINPDADMPIERDDVLVIIGKNEALNKLANK
jgi:trk system potassium uptake protein TrkA